MNKTLLASAALAVGAVLGMPQCHAQGSDALFMQELAAARIPGSQDAALHNAKLTCQWLDQGVDPKLVVTNMSTGTGLRLSQAATFVILAVGEYCPQYLPKPVVPPRDPKANRPKPQEPEYYGDEPFGPHLV